MIYIDRVVIFFGRISSYLVLILSILIVYDALNRYLFSAGLVSLQELEWHIFDLIFLLGLAYTLSSDEHVRVDILYSRYSSKTKTIISIVSTMLLTLPFIAVILYSSINFIYLSYIQNEISNNPGGLCCRYIIKSFIFIGFFLLGAQAISNTVKDIKRVL
jgi:TRAP-type mannitol/chloroaromatic compound transport system permease small subunit